MFEALNLIENEKEIINLDRKWKKIKDVVT